MVSSVTVTTTSTIIDSEFPELNNDSFSSFDNRVIAPVWDPPKFNPPSIRQRKWYNFFAWLGDTIAYGAYCIGYGIKYAGYSVWYGIQYVGAAFDYIGRAMNFGTHSLNRMNDVITYSNHLKSNNPLSNKTIGLVTNNDSSEAFRDGLLFNILNFNINTNTNTTNMTNNSNNTTNNIIDSNTTNNTNTTNNITDTTNNNTTTNSNITDTPDINGNVNCINAIGSYNCTNVTNALFCINVNNSRDIQYITNSNFIFDSEHGDNNINCANSSYFNNCINCTGIRNNNNKTNEYRDNDGWYHKTNSGSNDTKYSCWSDKSLLEKQIEYEQKRSQMKNGILNLLEIWTIAFGAVSAICALVTLICGLIAGPTGGASYTLNITINFFN
jgi:hypothetical protein